jgi:hypothetical protein
MPSVYTWTYHCHVCYCFYACSGTQHAASDETDCNGNCTSTANDSGTATTSTMRPQSPSISNRGVTTQHANRSSMSNRTPPSMTVATHESSSSRSIGGQLRKNRKSLFDTDASGDGSSSGNAVTNSAVKLFANVGRSRNKHNQQHTRYAYMHTYHSAKVAVFHEHLCSSVCMRTTSILSAAVITIIK